MSQEPHTPPPSYGSVTHQPQSIASVPPAESPGNNHGPPPPSSPYDYPQPGMPAPSSPYPDEPPPKYEAPKNQYAYPQGPPAGYPTGYPPAGSYPTQGSYPAGYQTGPVHCMHYTPGMRFTTIPQQIQCPHCGSNVVTSISYRPGALTWLSGSLLCLFGCWFGCCLIPFCMPDLQDVEHRCSSCGQYLGVHMRM